MSPQTQTSNGKKPILPMIQSGDEVYAQIMGGIEPDLVLTEQEREAKYAGESGADRAARLERYSDAIVEYKKQYQEYQDRQTGDIRSFGNALLKDFEGDDQKMESENISSLEAQIANL